MRKVLIVLLLAFSILCGPAATFTSSEVRPSASRQDRQEETVYITRTGKKYHRDGCRYLSQSKIPIKKKDAIARGYEACKVCKP
jgi:hypothetical protein